MEKSSCLLVVFRDTYADSKVRSPFTEGKCVRSGRLRERESVCVFVCESGREISRKSVECVTRRKKFCARGEYQKSWGKCERESVCGVCVSECVCLSVCVCVCVCV